MKRPHFNSKAAAIVAAIAFVLTGTAPAMAVQAQDDNTTQQTTTAAEQTVTTAAETTATAAETTTTAATESATTAEATTTTAAETTAAETTTTTAAETTTTETAAAAATATETATAANTAATAESVETPVSTLQETLIVQLQASISLLSYNNSTDISSAAVDSITFQYEDGTDTGGTVYIFDNFVVTVSFSEDDSDGNQKSGLDIEGGDTINVSWTAPTGVTFSGYNTTIYLYPDDDTTQDAIAEAVISESGCTITFYSNVESLQHVSGSVQFTVYVSGTLEGTDTTGSFTSGDVTSTIEVGTSTSTCCRL